MTLREAARALLLALDRHVWTMAARKQRDDLQAALADPPPGPDELHAMLDDLSCINTVNPGAHEVERHRLIAAILDLWPAKSEDGQ